MRAVLVAATVSLVAACGGSDDLAGVGDSPATADVGSTPASADDGVDVEPGEDPAFDPDDDVVTGLSVLVEAYGTTAGGPVDGFDRWDGGCDVAADADGPALDTGDISVPPTWEPIGSGDGIRLSIGDIEKNLSTGLSMHDPDIGAVAVLDTLFGTIDYEVVGEVEVGSDVVPVGFGGGAYRMASLAGSMRGNTSIDFYHELNFGLTGSGDITTVPLDTVLDVFGSFTIDPCVVDDETVVYAERSFLVVD